MCFEWKNRFRCGHVGFRKVERCNSLGSGCFGPDGSEQFVDIESLCYDCSARLQHNPASGTAERSPAAAGSTWAWTWPGTAAKSRTGTGTGPAAGASGGKPEAAEHGGGGGGSGNWAMSPGISPGTSTGVSPGASSGISPGT
ncbi:hypothetical protein VTH06DRAFT_7135 [Thermothelomyces fergusii]